MLNIRVIIYISTVVLGLISCNDAPKKLISDKALRVTIDSIQHHVDTIQLGRILEGEQINGRFIVENDKSTPLIITNIVTGCGCTTTSYDAKPIKPAEEREILFTFDSKGRQGLQIKTIDVISADFLMTRVVIKADVARN